MSTVGLSRGCRQAGIPNLMVQVGHSFFHIRFIRQRDDRNSG